VGALSPRTRRIAIASIAVAAVVAVAGPVGTRGALASSLGSGALVAAVALGVVLTHRSSGVVNFAGGATATYAAYAYAGVRRSGRLFLPPLPIPHWPASVSFGAPLNAASAFGITLVVAVVLGLGMHVLVFRPLRHAPPLAKTVASVGLLLVLQGIVVQRFTAQTVAVQPILTKRPVRFLGTSFASDQLVVGASVVVVAVALWAVFRFTRFGLATRAAAESEHGALLIGLPPDRLAGANWVLATVLAASFGVLAASVNASIDPTSITLLVIPAVGAALIGGLASFGVTAFAAFAVAGAQAVIQYLGATASWFPKAGGAPLPGLREALPFVVIVIVLFVRGDRLPTRGSTETTRLPFAPAPTHVAVNAGSAMLAGSIGVLLLGPGWRLAAINSLVGAVICLSLVVLTGFVGQVSLAQMAFAGVGGFTVSKLAVDHGIGFPIGPLAGALVAMALGLLAAVPALRVRGVNLAIVTLAAAATVENLVFRNSALSGGINGAPVPAPRFLGVKFGPNDAASFGDGKLPSPLFALFCLVVVVGLGVLVANLRRSATGRQLLAVRTNERAAAAGGIDVTRAKLLAFTVSSAIAGLGGALSAYRFGSVSATTFGSFTSIAFLAFAYLGGITTVTGAVIGGMFVANGVAFTALHDWFGVDPGLANLIGGVGLIVTAIVNPEGIAGGVVLAGRRLRNAVRPRDRRVHGVLAVALPDDGVVR
jgi:branched-chain amino acid transport system permease protein